jgi:hypothetical protein
VLEEFGLRQSRTLLEGILDGALEAILDGSGKAEVKQKPEPEPTKWNSTRYCCNSSGFRILPRTLFDAVGYGTLLRIDREEESLKPFY